MSEVLKPCPWCGELPQISEREDCDTIEVIHDCNVIEDVIDILMSDKPKGAAIEAWNKRSAE